MKRIFYLFVLMAVLVPISFLNAQWVKTFSGPYYDHPYDIKVTADGGLIVLGMTNSFGTGAGSYDAWLIKLDSASELQWERAIGGLGGETARSIFQTDDGGYIVGGSTESYGSGDLDFMVAKLFPDGSTDWIRTYGGIQRDELYSINSAPNGNILVAGISYSFASNQHAWFMLINSEGIPIWQKAYIGNIEGVGFSAIPTLDGGFILAGYSYQGTADSWLIKVDHQGARIWERTYGIGSVKDVMQLDTGDLVVATADRTLFKLTSEGDVFPGWGYSYANTLAPISQINSIEKTRDGGFIIVGHTNYLTPADNKIFALKLSSLFQLQWHKVFDFRLHDEGIAITEGESGGYYVAAVSLASISDPADFLVMKLASNGELGGTCSDTVVSDYQFAAISVASSESLLDAIDTEINPVQLIDVPNTRTYVEGILFCQGDIAEPYINELAPPSGPAGQEVVIKGWNFSMPPGTVLVDGLPATISSWSDFEISIAIPMYATHGLVIVTTSDQRQSNGRIFEITNEVPISQLPLKPVAGSITLDYGTYPPWSKKFPHSGCDYSSPQGSDVLSVGRGVVYKTKVDSLGFGSIDPLGRGPYIYIKYELSNGDPIYVLYGHTASSWVDMSTGIDTTKFWFSCSYSIELSEGQMIQRGDIVGHSAPFYNGGSAAPHLHLGVFKPKKDKKGIFYEPPFNNLGYSKLSLPTGDWIDPKIFFADYYLK